MRALKALTQMIPVLLLAIAFGCDRSAVTKTPFAHGKAVFHATAGGDSATSPVEENYSLDGKGQPARYQGRMALQQGAIEVRWEFVGTAFCPVTADGRAWDYTDVYALVITQDGNDPETIPVVYSGGQLMVVDAPGLRVELREEGRESARSADLSELGG
jgi:hypothetical protein